MLGSSFVLEFGELIPPLHADSRIVTHTIVAITFLTRSLFIFRKVLIKCILPSFPMARIDKRTALDLVVVQDQPLFVGKSSAENIQSSKFGATISYTNTPSEP